MLVAVSPTDRKMVSPSSAFFSSLLLVLLLLVLPRGGKLVADAATGQAQDPNPGNAIAKWLRRASPLASASTVHGSEGESNNNNNKPSSGLFAFEKELQDVAGSAPRHLLSSNPLGLPLSYPGDGGGGIQPLQDAAQDCQDELVDLAACVVTGAEGDLESCAACVASYFPAGISCATLGLTCPAVDACPTCSGCREQLKESLSCAFGCTEVVECSAEALLCPGESNDLYFCLLNVEDGARCLGCVTGYWNTPITSCADLDDETCQGIEECPTCGACGDEVVDWINCQSGTCQVSCEDETPPAPPPPSPPPPPTPPPPTPAPTPCPDEVIALTSCLATVPDGTECDNCIVGFWPDPITAATTCADFGVTCEALESCPCGDCGEQVVALTNCLTGCSLECPSGEDIPIDDGEGGDDADDEVERGEGEDGDSTTDEGGAPETGGDGDSDSDGDEATEIPTEGKDGDSTAGEGGAPETGGDGDGDGDTDERGEGEDAGGDAATEIPTDPESAVSDAGGDAATEIPTDPESAAPTVAMVDYECPEDLLSDPIFLESGGGTFYTEADAVNFGEIFSWSRDVVYDSSTGDAVGVSSGVCTVVEESNADGVVSYLCTEYIAMNGGSSLVMSGIWSTELDADGGTGSYTITGGSGCFAGVSGTVAQTINVETGLLESTISIEKV